MINYAICEISGKQYKVLPNKPLLVDLLKDEKTVEAKVLVLSDGEKLEVGNPYLKTPLKLEVLETVKTDKIRVSKYHAKANYRRVIGSRAQKSKVMLKA